MENYNPNEGFKINPLEENNLKEPKHSKTRKNENGSVMTFFTFVCLSFPNIRRIYLRFMFWTRLNNRTGPKMVPKKSESMVKLKKNLVQ